MRLTITVLTLLLLLAGCECSPAEAVPVTLRVVNPGKDPFYVDATKGQVGLTVKRQVGGEPVAFDDLACECRSCARVCDASCSCPDAGAFIARVDPGQRRERVWDGQIQLASFSSCGDGTCLDQVNAPVNEAFVLELCFTNQRPSVVFDDGGVAAGIFDRPSRECVEKPFRISEGVVEISPARGSTCETSEDCTGDDELCFDGACTAGCPANDFPRSGSIFIGLDNMGFFTQGSRTGGLITFTGAGTITSIGFQGQTLRLALSRGPDGGALTGAVTVALPPALGPPLSAGQAVAVTVVRRRVDGVDRHGVVIRDPATQALLFAADMAFGGEVLEPQDVVPFSLSSGTVPVGCTTGACGKELFFRRQVSAAGTSDTLSLAPGRKGTLRIPAGTYTVVNVTNSRAESGDDCLEQRQFAIWRESGN